jgi:hypothetical protein
MSETPKPCPEWVWTSSIVLGWCDAAGCESVGHKDNNCRLARALAAEVVSRTPLPQAQGGGEREAVIEAAFEVARILQATDLAQIWVKYDNPKAPNADLRKALRGLIAALAPRQEETK